MLTPISLLFPLIPIEILLSTKGLMFLLLSAYGGAMWTFLSGAPRVHTVMVSDLDRAKKFYEEDLKLSEAELPLQYYYGYDQSLVGSAFDAAYFPGDIAGSRRLNYSQPDPPVPDTPGLWYQLSDNVQLHVIPGNTEEGDASKLNQYEASISAYGSSTYASSQPYSTATARFRHTSFDRDTVKALLKYMIKHQVSHSVRSEKPLKFWVKDAAGQILEFAEVNA